MKITRNQFLLAPNSVIQSQKIDAAGSFSFGNYLVFIGEGCQCTMAQKPEKAAILLGYAVDAKTLVTDSRLLVESFLETLDENPENVLDSVKYWGGRWCLVFRTGGAVSVITDACGLKQVFYYTFIEKGNITIASQARYLAFVYCLLENPSAQSYIEKVQQIDKEYSWPLDGCLYERVKRLLPNHILIEGEKGPKRLPIRRLRLNDSAAEMALLLKDQMKAVQSTGKSAVTLTAGWDSRLVLAASDKSDVNLKSVTLLYQGATEDNADIRVAREICEQVGLEHNVIRCKPLSPDFEEEYKQHSEAPHTYWIQMSQSIRDAGFGDYYWVKGSCNEILRKSTGVLYNWQVSGKVLCKLFQIHYDNYSDSIIGSWLKSARPFCEKHHLDLLDLFYWEHRCGSWLAECLNESDVASEMFTPFNCRAYIEAGLDVGNKYKVSPNYSLFKEILKQLSFDLNIPINQGRYASLKSKVRCVIKNRLHLLYGLIIQLKPLV